MVGEPRGRLPARGRAAQGSVRRSRCRRTDDMHTQLSAPYTCAPHGGRRVERACMVRSYRLLPSVHGAVWYRSPYHPLLIIPFSFPYPACLYNSGGAGPEARPCRVTELWPLCLPLDELAAFYAAGSGQLGACWAAPRHAPRHAPRAARALCAVAARTRKLHGLPTYDAFYTL